MTRDRWEKILFANVRDEVVQDMLNEYVLELEAENAKLQEVVSDGEETAHLILYESRALEAENAKLRSMVHDMRYCIKRNHRCDDCDFNVGTDCLLFVNINKRMRELGVEVGDEQPC